MHNRYFYAFFFPLTKVNPFQVSDIGSCLFVDIDEGLVDYVRTGANAKLGTITESFDRLWPILEVGSP